MREPLQPPDGNSNRHIHYIEIRHPAYPRSEPPLLRLAAVENDDQDVAVLDHNVALLACGIITGNTWATGYLATQTGDKNYAKVHLSPNGMLHDAEYFYFIYDHSPDCERPYRMSDEFKLITDPSEQISTTSSYHSITGDFRTGTSQLSFKRLLYLEDQACLVSVEKPLL